MPEGSITMSHREVDRLSVIQSVISKQIRQVDAARQLSLSTRQIKRLVRRYRDQGAAGLVSARRGQRANNAIPDAIRLEVMEVVRTLYHDFSPTFAHEKLTEKHHYRFSVETLRKWMMAEGIWNSKKRKRARIHQRRLRRPCVGELIQVDGSPHDWFEGRSSKCTLIVFIDDATSRLMELRFAPAETTQAYMESLRTYLGQYGRPVAIYSDRHSIFRVNNSKNEGNLTQFSRALKTLDIEPIHANSPQAKGRVERANQTLQDRLIKEMRLQGINDIDSANAFLPEFLADYNARFAVPPPSNNDAHREVLHGAAELEQIFSLHHTRVISKNLTLQFKNREYQIQGYGNGYRMRKACVTVCEAFNGAVTILYHGQVLRWRLFAEGEPPISLDDEKSVYHTVEQAKKTQRRRPRNKPAPDHPWNKAAKIATQNST